MNEIENSPQEVAACNGQDQAILHPGVMFRRLLPSEPEHSINTAVGGSLP